LLVRLMLWNVLPNNRNAHFFNLWVGKRNLPRFRSRIAEDLGNIFGLAAKGALSAQVAARIPLTEAARAMELAESSTVVGKVVIVADTHH